METKAKGAGRKVFGRWKLDEAARGILQGGILG
jgi:hypothetical protein